MRLISFAQEYEDIILYSALKEYVQKGFYVDIGANDPCIISVTKFFYELGWRGINIEPLDDMFELLCCERKDDLNIKVGVSDKNEDLEFSVAGALSSFCNTEMGSEKIVQKVRMFKDIWKEINCGENKRDVHFCKIDVEGYEENVLKGIDFKTFRPWIFCIESTVPGMGTSCYDKWEEILTSNGYLFAFQYGINRYYIEKSRQFLKEGLVGFGRMFKENEIWQVSYKNNYQVNKNWLNRHKKFIIFGAGNFAQNFIEIYGDQYKPIAIVDNSVEKRGTFLLGQKVDSPAVLKDYKDIAVLICCKTSDAIRNQLREMGVMNYANYNFVQKIW